MRKLSRTITAACLGLVAVTPIHAGTFEDQLRQEQAKQQEQATKEAQERQAAEGRRAADEAAKAKLSPYDRYFAGVKESVEKESPDFFKGMHKFFDGFQKIPDFDLAKSCTVDGKPPQFLGGWTNANANQFLEALYAKSIREHDLGVQLRPAEDTTLRAYAKLKERLREGLVGGSDGRCFGMPVPELLLALANSVEQHVKETVVPMAKEAVAAGQQERAAKAASSKAASEKAAAEKAAADAPRLAALKSGKAKVSSEADARLMYPGAFAKPSTLIYSPKASPDNTVHYTVARLSKVENGGKTLIYSTEYQAGAYLVVEVDSKTSLAGQQAVQRKNGIVGRYVKNRNLTLVGGRTVTAAVVQALAIF